MADVLQKIASQLYAGEADDVAALVQSALDKGLSASEVLQGGLIAGMDQVGRDFKAGDLFVPEVLIAARAMHAGMNVLRPLLAKSGAPSAGITHGEIEGARFIDLAPTILHLMNVPVPDDMDGCVLTEVLVKREPIKTQAVCHHQRVHYLSHFNEKETVNMSGKIILAFCRHSKALNAHWHKLVIAMSPTVALLALATVIAARAGGPIASGLSSLEQESLTWNIETVDNSGDVGQANSLVVDSAGKPHISYCDATTRNLKYAYWTGNAWTIQVVDNMGFGCSVTSLALDNSGTPHISYGYSQIFFGIASYSLRYASWTGGAWVTQTVDGGGPGISLALDGAGNPRIAYGHCTYGRPCFSVIRYARWTGSAWDIQTVDGERPPYELQGPSLALDRGGNPHISYGTSDLGEIRYASWISNNWITQTVDTVAPGSGYFWSASLALDKADVPHVSYTRCAYSCSSSRELRYTSWTGNQWVTQTVGTYSDFAPTSLALDSSGNPHISYSGNNALKYVRQVGSSWVALTVSGGISPTYSSLSLDRSGNPHISYYDSTTHSLKYAAGSWPGSYLFAPDGAKVAEPGGQAIYMHTLQNTGSLTDTYQLTYDSSHNWATLSGAVETGTLLLPGSVTLTPGQSALITVTVSVPNGTAYLGTVDTTVITATSVLSPTLVKRVTDTTLVPRSRIYMPIILHN